MAQTWDMNNADGVIYACLGPVGPCTNIGQVNGLNAKVGMGDMNHDGVPDLIIGASQGNLWYVPATPAPPAP